MIAAMDAMNTMLNRASDADDQATHELESESPQNREHAAVWAQLATARSIAALALSVQSIADAMNFHAGS